MKQTPDFKKDEGNILLGGRVFLLVAGLFFLHTV